jgi:hypothetical protein
MSDDELAREVTRSMREEHSRWSAPDHGWNVDLYCRRDDGLEAMKDRTFFDEAPRLRVQGLGAPGNHYSQSMSLKPVRITIGGWLGGSRALLEEMEALHREKHERESDAALKTLRRA